MGLLKKMMMEKEENPESFLKGKFVCADHFKDHYLKEFIKVKGSSGKCSYCGKETHVMDMRGFISDIKTKLQRSVSPIDNADLPLSSSFLDSDDEKIPGFTNTGLYIRPTAAEYYDSAAEMLYAYGLEGRNTQLNADIESCFKVQEWIKKDPFQSDWNVELSYAWNQFSDLVKYQRRFTFFNDKSFFRDLQIPIDTLTEIRMVCTDVLCEKLNAGTELYRGRPCSSSGTWSTFDDLTAPPKKYAKENRMSAAGISMFYGAFSRETSISEIRNYNLYDPIALGVFKTKKTLKVVNLCNIPGPISFWMPSCYEESKFLQKFHDEVSKPIIENPGIEYVPTQIFTEYIRYMNDENIDGLIYKSSVGDDKNIVLFYDHESSKEVMDLIDVHSISGAGVSSSMTKSGKVLSRRKMSKLIM